MFMSVLFILYLSQFIYVKISGLSHAYTWTCRYLMIANDFSKTTGFRDVGKIWPVNFYNEGNHIMTIPSFRCKTRKPQSKTHLPSRQRVKRIESSSFRFHYLNSFASVIKAEVRVPVRVSKMYIHFSRYNVLNSLYT